VLTIVSGSIEKVKSEMKQVAKWKAEEIKDTKKQIKAWKDREKKAAREEKRKENSPPKELDQHLGELEKLKELYSSSRLPVRVGNITIDFKAYQKAIAKLQGFEFDIKLTPDEMIMHYKKQKSKGAVYLFDISTYFKDLLYIPIAEIRQDG
jgi:seryl-tRNA(Sec) selenium transferase